MAKDESDSTEKKRPATRSRLRQAREQGNAPKSKDLTAAVVLAAWVVAGGLGSQLFVKAWEERTDVVLSNTVHPTTEFLAQSLWSCSTLLASTVLALLAPIALIGLLAQFAQVGPIFALGKVNPDPSHLNPAIWMKRLVKWETGVELLKGIAKQVLILAVGYAAAASSLPQILSLSAGKPDSVLPLLAKILQHLFASAAAIGLGLGLLDLLYQRFIFLQDMRMTVADFQRDQKTTEGDPKLKSRRKQLYLEWANYNAAEATRGAMVVVTNPTHYAVALAYDPTVHAAPIVAAKGQDQVAAEIRNAAENADVPIIRSPSLARELHARVEIDHIVPEDLFIVVAEVIVWANRLRQTSTGQEPAASDNQTGAG